MASRIFRSAVRVGFAALLTASVAAACGGGDDDDAGSAGTDKLSSPSDLAGSAASFEVVAGRPQRVLLGFSTGDGLVLAHGAIEVEFRYGGTQSSPQEPAGDPVTATATFLPVPGQTAAAGTAGETPRLVRPSEAIGVYQATGVTFDQAGFWQAQAVAATDQGERTAEAWLQVREGPGVPDVGEDAPRTDNPVIGTAGVQPVWLDSRASDQGTGGTIPDEVLHTVRIADTIAAGRPLVVVVSTPVFCQSRFCGPITDTVERLAGSYGDRVDFAHLEVWQDFTNQKLNPWAEEWIVPRDGGNGAEPWVFLVGRDGKVAQRFDNVVSDAALEAAIAELAEG